MKKYLTALALTCIAGPAFATNDFTYETGTNGFRGTPTTLLSTELNTLTNGSAVTSSVGGASGVFSQSTLSSGIWGTCIFKAGGAMSGAPTAGAFLQGWFAKSNDGGTTFESLISTPSATVQALARPPDFIINVYEGGANFATNNTAWTNGDPITLPATSYKVVLQNMSGVSLASSGNTLQCGSYAVLYPN